MAPNFIFRQILISLLMTVIFTRVGPGVHGARHMITALDIYGDYLNPAADWYHLGLFMLRFLWIVSASRLAKSCYDLAGLILKKRAPTCKQGVVYLLIIFTPLVIVLEVGTKGLCFNEKLSVLLELFTEAYGALALMGFVVLFKHHNQTKMPTLYAAGLYQYLLVVIVMYTLLLNDEYSGLTSFLRPLSVKIFLVLSEQSAVWCIKSYGCVARHLQHDFQLFVHMKDLLCIQNFVVFIVSELLHHLGYETGFHIILFVVAAAGSHVYLRKVV